MSYNSVMTLQEYLVESGRTQASFARAIGCDRGNFNRLLKGLLQPTVELAIAIETETAGKVSAAELSPLVRLARDTAPAADAETPVSMADSSDIPPRPGQRESVAVVPPAGRAA